MNETLVRLSGGSHVTPKTNREKGQSVLNKRQTDRQTLHSTCLSFGPKTREQNFTSLSWQLTLVVVFNDDCLDPHQKTAVNTFGQMQQKTQGKNPKCIWEERTTLYGLIVTIHWPDRVITT